MSTDNKSRLGMVAMAIISMVALALAFLGATRGSWLLVGVGVGGAALLLIGAVTVMRGKAQHRGSSSAAP